ncbi:MAG: arsenate reductase ArsC [Bacteroidaceae bacterium]|nr:arsenate reductase ArsC [Bacteroidaceae bacterium]
MRVLILCTGNSCRSQMAHGFLQSLDKSLDVHSAGTNPASQVNSRAIEVMREVGIDISTHTPKNVEIYLNDEWDYVITVCGGANETCPMFVGKVGKRLHIGFDDPAQVVGNSSYIMSEFCRVRDEIKNQFIEFYTTHILPKV